MGIELLFFLGPLNKNFDLLLSRCCASSRRRKRGATCGYDCGLQWTSAEADRPLWSKCGSITSTFEPDSPAEEL